MSDIENVPGAQNSSQVVALIVNREQLKQCNEALGEQGLCHATFKTKPYNNDTTRGAFAIPTSLSPVTDLQADSSSISIEDLRGETADPDSSSSTLPLGCHDYPVTVLSHDFFSRSRPSPPTPSSIIATCFHSTLSTTPLAALASSLPTSYTLYSTLLLFPPSSIPPSWTPHLLSPSLTPFFSALAHATHTTHIALNAPIPLSTSAGHSNLLRSPSNLTPLHGAWGPPSASHPPTDADFATAFWAEATQNGLRQVWAPRWTMFSARNVREKTRLLGLASVAGRARGATAVDLYVGIGYFAFSYLKAGLGVVLGWDLNGWSIEGARRGAERNGFGERLRVFCEDNARARERVEVLRESLPPVRHVNCGLLPTSRGSWETAVGVLDKKLGGWVHVHENFGVEEVEGKAEEVRRVMEGIVQGSGEWDRETRVVVEEVFRVKSYAPGVVHVVVDIRIDPGGDEGIAG